MMQRILFSLVLLCSFYTLTIAQKLVSGIVTDRYNQPLIGASIIEKGTINTTVTDFEGRFQLTLTDSLATVVVAHVGYSSEERQMDGETREYHFLLNQNVYLDEVVVVGGERRKYSSKAPKTSVSIRGRSSIPTPPSTPPPPPPGSPAYYSTYAAKPLMARSDDSPVMARDGAVLAVDKGGLSAVSRSAGAGTLTAGEIHDFSKWDLWKDIADEDLQNWREYWQLYPDQRYPLQLTNHNGQAVVNAVVKLLDEKGTLVWQSRTDNTGKAELWDNLFTARKSANRQLRMVVTYEGQEYPVNNLSSFQQGYNFLSIPATCNDKPAVDIVFVVDATGSMQDEIDYLKAELQDVIQRVKDTLPDADLSLGSVFYRDQGEAYLTRKSPLSSTISRTTDFIQKQDADGGGDNPEAVEEALRVAVEEIDWREEASTRLMFLVLDAPPHQSPEILATLERVTRQAAAQGIRIIPLTCSGIDKSTEYLMRSLALATNGTYTFLTNDSGVGYTHIEPTTDGYDVEKLNALLARVIYQFTYIRECRETPVIALNQAVDTAYVVAQATLPEDRKPDHPAFSLRFYPNPSSGPVNIETNGIGELFLADFSGKILERFKVSDNRSSIDIGRYPAGTYHLRFRTDKDEWLGDQLVLTR